MNKSFLNRSVILLWAYFGIVVMCKAQTNIVNVNITAFNVMPRQLLDVTIMNSGIETMVTVETKLYSNNQDLILTVASKPFYLKKGLNTSVQLNILPATTVYGSSGQADYVKRTHTLPNGKWRYCTTLAGVDVSDQLCDDIEAENTSFLYLVSPPDKEEIETFNPLLIWTHSEPFTSQPASESYRMVVAEMLPDQSPEVAINTNVPVYMKNNLTMHQVQYPFDAKALQPGKQYAWQVQQLSSGVIVNKTEAWQFHYKKPDDKPGKNYTYLRQNLDGSTYYAVDEKIYFKFDEPYYTAESKLIAKIYDANRKAYEPEAKNEVKKQNESVIKYTGTNLFTMDLSSFHLSSGIYNLEVTDEKGKIYLLQFMIK